MAEVNDPQIKDQSIKLYSVSEHVNWGSIVVPAIAFFLAVGGIAFLSTIWVRTQAEHEIRRLLVNRPYGALKYKSLRASLLFDSIEIRGIEYVPKDTEEKITIQRIIIDDPGRDFIFSIVKNGLSLPHDFKLGIVGFNAPISFLSFQKQAQLIELGYQRINLSMSVKVSLNSRTSRLLLDKIVIDAMDAGRFQGSMIVDGFMFPPDKEAFDGLFEMTNMLETQTWRTSFMTHADVKFINNQLVDRLQNRAQARKENGAFEFWGINNRNVASSKSIDFTTLAGKQLIKLSTGRSIHLKFEPKAGIPMRDFALTDFANLDEAQKKYGLSLLAD